MNIADTLNNTYNNKGKEINSLISVLGIQPAKITESVEISKDTEIILDTLSSLVTRLNSIENSFILSKSQLDSINNIDESSGNWKVVENGGRDLIVGDIVTPQKFGKGRVISIDKRSSDFTIQVDFLSVGNKTLLAQFAKIKKFYK